MLVRTWYDTGLVYTFQKAACFPKLNSSSLALSCNKKVLWIAMCDNGLFYTNIV